MCVSQVKGRSNLWTQGQQYQIDVSTIEELFSQRDCQSNAKATPTRGGVSRGSFREVKDVCVCVLFVEGVFPPQTNPPRLYLRSPSSTPSEG